jgi:uncharacterized protein with FMN-binding domain
MEERQPAAYYALLGVTVVFKVLAVVTLLPSPVASKPNVLGYRSVCSFAPAASALCGLLAGVTCTIRNRLVSRKAASARYAPPFAPLAAAVVLLAVVAVFAVRFAKVQSRFVAVIEKTAKAGSAFGPLADGVRSASASEGDMSAMVEMAVASGRVQDLKLTSGKNVDAALAAQLFQEVITAQSSAVDAVSGATASSRVLLKAVAAAAAANP